MKRLLAIVLSVFLLIGLAIPAAAAEDAADDEGSPLVISEIYPNAEGNSASAEKGKEFLRLTNIGAEDLPLSSYAISLGADADTAVELPDEVILPAGTSLVVYPIFGSLLNGGGVVSLHSESGEVIQEITYPAFPSSEENLSWQLAETGWSKLDIATGYPGVELILDALPETSETEEETEAPTDEEDGLDYTIDFPLILINELLPDPDTTLGQQEFIELYNPNTVDVSLEGYRLRTSSGTKNSHVFGKSDVISAGGYLSVGTLTLTNSGGYAWLENPAWAIGSESSRISETDAYNSAKKGVSWSVINDSWAWSLPTAGDENKPLPTEEKVLKDNEALKPCPAGKFRNPATNRCKNIVDTATSLLPCRAGQARNPETNRCRSILNASSRLTPCKPGQERNPATNRCRKVSSTTNGLKPCAEGQERNPETNRCRRVATVLSSTDTPTVNGQTSPLPLNSGVTTSVMMLALAYGIYEYRLDASNWIARLRGKL